MICFSRVQIFVFSLWLLTHFALSCWLCLVFSNAIIYHIVLFCNWLKIFYDAKFSANYKATVAAMATSSSSALTTVLVFWWNEGRQITCLVSSDSTSGHRSKSRHNERSNKDGRSWVAWSDVSRSRRTSQGSPGDDRLPAIQKRENAIPGRRCNTSLQSSQNN